MEQNDIKVWALSHVYDGPVAAHFDAVAKWLDLQGYRRRCIGLQLQFVVRFDRWLKANHVRIDDLTEDHAERFKVRCSARHRLPRGFSATLYRLLEFLRNSGNIVARPPAAKELTRVQRIVNEYCQHLRNGQGLTRLTCVQYAPFVEQFLIDRFGTDPIDLSILRAADVISFIQQRASRLSQARARCATIALRSFMRYLRYKGETTLDLAAAVPAVPNWSMTAIPRAMAADHVQAVLAACPRDTSTGCRDYAILMLMSRLGLRAGEIAVLTLDCIDWENGSLVVHGKAGTCSILPMPADVGEAVAMYLKRGRPRCECRTLFLCANAPTRGFSSSTSVGSLVLAAIIRSGIETRHKGSHQFRHALACEMLRQGATLPEIGSLLRHRHSKTTGIYAKVDFAALRPLSLPWPGGAQ